MWYSFVYFGQTLWYHHRPYLLTDLIFDLGNTYLTVWTNIIYKEVTSWMCMRLQYRMYQKTKQALRQNVLFICSHFHIRMHRYNDFQVAYSTPITCTRSYKEALQNKYKQYLALLITTYDDVFLSTTLMPLTVCRLSHLTARNLH